MLHYGTMTFDGHSKDMTRWALENDRLNALMEAHILERIKEKHPRYKRETLQELIKFDTFLSATDAVELGLADKVV